MNKVILTIVVVLVGFIGFAQDKADTSKQSKYVTTSNGLVVFRMTDEMTDDEIRVEFINNFFKIELSDLVLNQNGSLSKNQDNTFDEAEHSIKDEFNISNQIITSDLAIRTTIEMRPSVYSAEEITA